MYSVLTVHTLLFAVFAACIVPTAICEWTWDPLGETGGCSDVAEVTRINLVHFEGP